MLKKPMMAGALAMAFAATGHAAIPDASQLVPLQHVVDDRTQEMWSARWWMWAASFDGAGPVTDTTGDLCGMRQEGEVFFLAGTYEHGPIQRTCKVPAGKHLFFPLVAWIVMPDGAGPCQDLTAQARAMTDRPKAMYLELDGVRQPDMEKRRVASSCFNVGALRGGPKMMGASNGYWAMLEPLAPGRHTLHFGGTLPSLAQDVTYTLLVE